MSDGSDSNNAGLEQFALNFHTDEYDGEIERQLAIDSLIHSSRNNAIEHQLARDHAIHNLRNNVGGQSQNRPPDWEERKARALQNLKMRLQLITQQVGSCPVDVDVGVLGPFLLTSCTHGSRFRNSASAVEHVVEHEAPLDPYWNELSNVLSQPKSFKWLSMHVTKVQLTKETMALLATCLTGKIRNAISLDNTQLCEEGINSLSTLLKNNPSVGRLKLSNNPFTSLNAAVRLSQSLKAHTQMKKIVLSSCGLGNNVDILSVILQSDVEEIDLSHNEIGSPGAVTITNYLQTNTPMRSLTLANNMLNDDDAILFAQALKKNTNLLGLSIYNNKFTLVGVKAMIKGLFDPSSLNAISESNHTCTLKLLGTSNVQGHIARVNKLDLDRKGKLLIVLHEKESLLKYLEDFPVELMPEVLAFIQAEKYQEKLVNMIYSALRGWNMPSLYSYHHTPSKMRKTIE